MAQLKIVLQPRRKSRAAIPGPREAKKELDDDYVTVQNT
jgi:hypothetical protein